MDEKFKRIFYKALIRILVISVLANWSVLALYFYKFGPGNWFELSSSQEVWAHFGTFYSGLLSPFLGFLAFIGILFTLLLQMQQLDLAKQQAEIQEMQRVLASISTQIDQMMNAAPTFFAAKKQVRDDVAPLTLFGHISAFGAGFLNPSADQELENAFNEAIFHDVRQDISPSIRPLTLELHNLGWALQTYSKSGGSKTIAEFYNFRYGALVAYLDVMGELGDGSYIRNVFDLDMLKKALTVENAQAS